jgi:copper chaperone for superoxide dismutase/copper chaperone
MLLDLTVRFPGYPKETVASGSALSQPAEEYDVYVASTGDVSDPPRTTGKPKLPLTRVTPDVATGYADAFLEVPVGLWDIIGRAMVVEPVGRDTAISTPPPGAPSGTIAQEGVKGFRKGRLGILAGVIARSAGAWGNEVCARAA